MMEITTENIWNDFNKELYGFIKKKVKSSDIADDILQDVFVKIHLKLSTLSNSDKLISWVYQITRNSILDYFRRSKHFAEMPDDLIVLEDSEIYNDDFVKCLKPMLNQLPEIYKDAIINTELGNLSQKEFAEKSGISYSGAKSRVQRGRQQLSELFRQRCKVKADRYGNIIDFHTNENCKLC